MTDCKCTYWCYWTYVTGCYCCITTGCYYYIGIDIGCTKVGTTIGDGYIYWIGTDSDFFKGT